MYFTLKDQNAQIRCALFKSVLARSAYKPKEGDQVLLRGKLSLYEGRGDYQIIVSNIQPEGEGALQAAFFKLKEKLEREGLFAPEHKQPLPAVIRRVGIVTSRTGAALHDILTVLKRRFPAISVILYPVQVQGADAPGQIISAIETANRLNQVDVLIVGRGGGSLEDLWSFNDEGVARAVFASQLPIVSAVGHEVDVSISDFVADVRAATPSQAAELVSPDQADLYSLINHRRDQLTRRWLSIRQTAQQRLSHLRQRLRDPGTLLHEWQQRLDDRERRLVHALHNQQRLRLQRFESLEKRLHRASPLARLKTDQQRLGQWRQRLQRLGYEQIKPRRQQLASLAGQLNTLSPLNTLERGYSITRTEDGQVIQQASQTKAGDRITTLLRDGTLTSRVE